MKRPMRAGPSGQEGCKHGCLLLGNGEVGGLWEERKDKYILSLLKCKYYRWTGLYLVQNNEKQGSPMWGGPRQPGWAEQKVLQSRRD